LTRSGKSFGTFVALLTVGLAGTAHAAWEAPQRIDTEGEDRAGSGAGEIAVGTNGLTTVFFFQSTDTGTLKLFRRRAGDASSWSAPASVEFFAKTTGEVVSPDNPQPELDANDAGTAGVAMRALRNIVQPGVPGPPPAPTADHVTIFGGGWPAAVEAPSSLKQLLGDETKADATTGDAPDVDIDGAGVGHVVAAIDPAAAEGPPPSDQGAEIRYAQFDPATGNRGTGAGSSQTFVKHNEPPSQEDPDPRPDGNQPFEPGSRPRLDVNEDGDVAVSFVAISNARQIDPTKVERPAVYVARRLKGAGWVGPVQMSQAAETDAVTQHDVAIAPDGTITLVFAANPGGTNNRIYARRWLASSTSPRKDEFSELISSSAANRPAASNPKIVSDDAGRLTAAWTEGGSQLFSAERTTNWSLPQALSTGAGQFDLAADAEGTATIVYREATNVKGRRRATGKEWGDPDTINTAAIDTGVAPRVDARKPLQADVYFVQANGALKTAYASRFTGVAPTTPEAPPKPDTEDCPGDINIVAGGSGDDVKAGTADRDTIMGGDGNDKLTGDAADGCIRGQGGNDTANGDAGSDNVGGGDGDDTVNGGADNDTVGGAAGADTVGGDAGDDTGTGGDGNDTVNGDDGNDVLSGDAGDDKVNGGAGDDTAGGGDGNDTVNGDAGTNVLYGGTGDDTVVGGPEVDTLLGEDGNDKLRGGLGDGDLQGGAGRDRLIGSDDNDKLDGGTENDVLKSGAGDDELKGGLGNDTLRGGLGIDRMFGDAGRDKLFGDAERDRIDGGFGNDRIDGGKGNDRLFGNKGDDRIKGGKGKDRISAGDGEDRVNAADRKRDRVTCGGGLDKVTADWIDKVARSCEQVKRVGKKPKSKKSKKSQAKANA
jgi:Ca2+-binding RTX toxin-like protein